MMDNLEFVTVYEKSSWIIHRLISAYDQLYIPSSDHLTEYFGDYGETYPKQGVTPLQLKERSEVALAALNMTLQEYENSGIYNTTEEIRAALKNAAPLQRRRQTVSSLDTELTVVYGDEGQIIRFDGWNPQEQPLNDWMAAVRAYATEHDVKYDLSMGTLGNGITVWNRLHEENGDFKTIAHISHNGMLTEYVPLPEYIHKELEKVCKELKEPTHTHKNIEKRENIMER